MKSAKSQGSAKFKRVAGVIIDTRALSRLALAAGSETQSPPSSIVFYENSHSMSTTGVGLSLILGGALGNLWDRVVSGRVVDFLLFYVGQYQWPAFNVADSAIVVGAALLVYEILFTKTPAAANSA